MSFKYHEQITKQDLHKMDTGVVPASLRDFSVSDDADKPITAGLFKLTARDSLEYSYTYDEMKLINEGTFLMEDETGQKVTATTGYLLYFPKDTLIKFSTLNFGVGFFYGQRCEDEA